MKYNMLRFPGFRDRAVTLSYDDGVIYDQKLLEIIKKYSLKCTFNINSGLLSGENRKMTKEQALALYDGSCEIACHGEKHLKLTDVDSARAVYEIITDRKNLEEWFCRRVNGMAYAFGSFDENAIKILQQCGIKYSRTTISSHNFDLPENWLALKPTCHHTECNLFELVDKFLNYSEPEWKKQPQVFYLWGHSYEFADNDNWEILEQFCEKVANKEYIWYATNVQIYDYVKAFEKLEFSVDSKRIFNPTSTTLYLRVFGKDVVIRGGEEVSL